MNLRSPFRRSLSAALMLLVAIPSFARLPGVKTPSPPKPAKPIRAPQNLERRPEVRSQIEARPQPQATIPHSAGAVTGNAPHGHLEQWMENHKNLPLADQQRALQNEPGFRELPAEVQQRQLNTLGRLYTMDPEQRTRMLNRVEGLERLNPQQQQQWGHAVQQLNVVSPPRRRLMTRAIIDLREMPSDQRQQVIDSPDFAAQFSPEERQTIRTVLTAY